MGQGAVVARILSEYSDKGSKAAQKDLKSMGKSFDDFGAKVKKAFEVAAAAGAAFAVKVGYDAVKAAMADQQSQAILAQTLKNTTGANQAAIDSTEAYIKATELRLGVVDTQLRPSMNALVTATGNVTKAEQLQQLALNISAGKGKDLTQVSIALAKAYDGNFSALKRLGIPLSETLVKSKNFTGIVNELSAAVKGDATVAANSLAGETTRLGLSFDEAKKSLGYALMPAVQSFIDQLNTQILPKVQAWIDLNKDKLVKGLKTAADEVVNLVKKAIGFTEWISTHMTLIKDFGIALGALWATTKIIAFVSAVQKVATAFKAMAAAESLAAVAEAFLTGGISVAVGSLAAGVAVAALATYGLISNLNSATDATVQLTQAQKDLNNPLSGKAFGSSTWLKESAKVKAQQAEYTKTAIDNITKLSAAQEAAAIKKAKSDAATILAQQTLNKLTATNGITTTNSTDPVELEAARLNLQKQGNVEAQNKFDVLIKSIQAQTSLNDASSKYSDILGVLADQHISSAEIETLSSKWGMSDSAVVSYIDKVTKVGTVPSNWIDPINKGADAWQRQVDYSNQVLANMIAMGNQVAPNPYLGAVSTAVNVPTVTPSVSTAAAALTSASGSLLNQATAGTNGLGGQRDLSNYGGSPVVNVTVQGSVTTSQDLASVISDHILRTVHSGSNFLQFSATGGL